MFKKGAILAGYASGYSCYPILSSFLSLFPLLLTGNRFTVQNVFTTLALLGVLQKPVTVQFAFELRSLFQAMTTLERTESFLLTDNNNECVSRSLEREKSDLGDILTESGAMQLEREPQSEGMSHDNNECDYSLYSKSDSGDVCTNSCTMKLEKEPRCSMSNASNEKRYSLHSKSDSGDDCPNGCNTELGNKSQYESEFPLTIHELPQTRHVCHQGKPFLCLEKLHYLPWEHSCDFNLCISNSRFVAITGPVGCGKTSLFHKIIGEMPPASGRIAHQGRIAYACQTPWVFSGTIRQNILFGKEYNHDAYERAIEICSLTEDLALFPRGDMTHVGERGVSLSGGQRARVNLARAVYSNADIYLLDDPLSAVDVKVSKEIFHRCICGFLSDRIRLMITHDPICLQKAAWVLLMNKGGIITKGTYQELCESLKFPDIFTSTVAADEGSFPNTMVTFSDEPLESSDGLEPEHEDRMTGSVSYLTYWRYFTYGFSSILMVIMAVLLLLPEGK